MFGFFCSMNCHKNYAAVARTGSTRFNALFHGLLQRGVYLAPASCETGFVSAAHARDIG